ncbi:MAG: GNAT family protein [Actinomycetia bacterium]|nr:GNAT family protein [Actinomycetes bacterium]
MSHLRPWRETDAPVLLAAVEDRDLARQLPELDSLAAAEQWCRTEPDPDLRQWCIADEQDRPVGGAGAGLRRRMRVAWVWYWLLPEARGRGRATRALTALVGVLFAEGMFRIELRHRLSNPASQRVAERAGFIREGVLRSELEYDQVRYDTAVMSRLRTDPAPVTEPLPIQEDR